MILTCPECASRYQVADGSIPPQGRSVRCAACGSSWRVEAAAASAPITAAAPKSEDATEAARPAAAAIPKAIRAKEKAKRRTREAAAAGAVWGVLAASLCAVLICAGLFRVEVVRLWPRTAGAYAKVGLAVNPTGLAPENIQAAPGLKDGHVAVIVTGVVRNVESSAHDPAPLRISLLDKAGHPLAKQVVQLAPGRMAPGQTRPFSAAFIDPPTASADVQVEFALGLKPAKLVRTAEAPKLRGPQAAVAPPAPPAPEVTALPAGSPYALPPHEG